MAARSAARLALRARAIVTPQDCLGPSSVILMAVSKTSAPSINHVHTRATAVDMMDNASALPTCPQRQQQQPAIQKSG
jgi:hypothetical protein